MCIVCDAARAVIRGDYGNYPERKYRLENEGFDYDLVQSVVNAMLYQYPSGVIPSDVCFL